MLVASVWHSQEPAEPAQETLAVVSCSTTKTALPTCWATSSPEEASPSSPGSLCAQRSSCASHLATRCAVCSALSRAAAQGATGSKDTSGPANCPRGTASSSYLAALGAGATAAGASAAGATAAGASAAGATAAGANAIASRHCFLAASSASSSPTRALRSEARYRSAAFCSRHSRFDSSCLSRSARSSACAALRSASPGGGWLRKSTFAAQDELRAEAHAIAADVGFAGSSDA